MYGEKISEIMLRGYNLINEKQIKKACDTWLKTWEYIKQRYVPEIESISEVDERYNGSVHIYDWILDFLKVLFNQGLRQKQYFEERIQFSSEILEFFPKSDDYLIQNVMRFLGESYFYLGKQKEGEKLFKNLIEKFPKYTYGYIAWADFYAGVYKDHIQFDKAKSIYQSALKRCTENLDDVKKRIKQLEERRDGITHLEDLLSEYKSYLSEKNLSKKNKERKISDVRKLLDFIIRVNEMIYPEDMAEKLYPETILDFLGIWAIKEGYVSNQTSMIRLCRSTKSFFRFFQDFMILHEEELKEIREICNSKKFFIKRLEGFQKKNIGQLISQQRYKKYHEWESGVSKWYHWIKVKEEEAEREAKKVRLSKEKRKLFKDVDDFF
jgi:tetratricopeptide (TPR) repeat protein